MMEGELYASDASIVEWYTYPYIVEIKKMIMTIAASTGMMSFLFFFCLESELAEASLTFFWPAF